MADLLIEFFKRDLTEAEEERLGKLLSSSPDQSLRFASLAHHAYLQTGLPDVGGGPHPGSGQGLGGPGGGILPHLGPVLLKSVFLVAAAGMAAYGVYRVLSQAPRLSLSLPPAAHENLSPSPMEPPRRAVLKRKLASSPPLQVLPPQNRPKPGMVEPLAYDPSKKYEGLDVMVEQKTSGLMTVRALDGNKKEVRLLFAGLLKPGKWDFVWDGRTENGEEAIPGTYNVEVQSGGQVLSKEVVIRGESLADQK